jgi:hypothetical protein
MKEEIFVHCLMKDSLPYKIVKSIKPNYRIRFLELKEKLGISEPKLRSSVYHMTPYVFDNGDFVEIERRYDFVINGDRKTLNNIRIKVRKHNESLQEDSWDGGVLIV